MMYLIRATESRWADSEAGEDPSMSVVAVAIAVIAGLLLIGAVIFGVLRNSQAKTTPASGSKTHDYSATR